MISIKHNYPQKLDDVVESCVNEVGVNLNTASAPLLSHISGLSKKVADNIVAHREKEGIFNHRDEIKDVAGVWRFSVSTSSGISSHTRFKKSTR